MANAQSTSGPGAPPLDRSPSFRWSHPGFSYDSNNRDYDLQHLNLKAEDVEKLRKKDNVAVFKLYHGMPDMRVRAASQVSISPSIQNMPPPLSPNSGHTPPADERELIDTCTVLSVTDVHNRIRSLWRPVNAGFLRVL